MPEELWMEVHNIVQEAVIKTIPWKEMQKGKVVVWRSLTNTWEKKTAAAVAKSLQLCPTLCYPIDGSPPGSPIPGILRARTLEWVAISFSNAWKWKVKVKLLSRVRLLATPWTAAYQAPLPMEFSRQEKGKIHPFECRVPKNNKER